MVYRLYRLRRLVVLCLLLLAAGLAAGALLAGDGAPLAGQGALAALFAGSAVAVVAMALRWPRDAGTTLPFALGTGVMLAALIPASLYLGATDTRRDIAIALAVLFGPVLWPLGATLLGAGLLFPLNLMIRKSHTATTQYHLPMPPEDARKLFAFQPDTVSLFGTTGPVGWDGFWEERTHGRAPDPATGMIMDVTTVLRIKELASDQQSQSILAVLPTPAAPARGMPTSFVIHVALTPDGTGTRMVRRVNWDQVPVGVLLTGWLEDKRADAIMAECEAAAGHPPRAIAHLPVDSFWTAAQRFFKWDGSPQP